MFLEKLASKGQTAAQRAQAQCAVQYDAVRLSSEGPSWRDDAGAPTAPKDGEDGFTAKKPESVIGASQGMETQAQFLTQLADRHQAGPSSSLFQGRAVPAGAQATGAGARDRAGPRRETRSACEAGSQRATGSGMTTAAVTQ